MSSASSLVRAGLVAAALAVLLVRAGPVDGGESASPTMADCRAVLDALDTQASRSPEEVAASLAALGPGAVPHLLVLHRASPDPTRRAAIAAAITRLGGGDRERLLLATAASREDLLVRATALAMLEESATLAHVPDIVPLLRASEREIARGAEKTVVAAFRRVREGALAEPLTRLLNAAPMADRLALAECAILTSRAEVLPVLAELTGRDRTLDLLILCGLARMPGGTECEPMLRFARSCLDDTDPAFRRQAALGLGRLHDPESAGRLVALLSDPDDGVRGNAWHALREITGAEFPPDPRRWQVWYEAERKFWDVEGRRLLAILDGGSDAEVVDAMRVLSLHPLYRDLVARAFGAFLEDERPAIRAVAETVLGVSGGGPDGAGLQAAGALAWFEARPTGQVPVRPVETAAAPPDPGPGGSLITLIVGGGVLLGLALRLAGVTAGDRGKAPRRAGSSGPVTVVVQHRWAKSATRRTVAPQIARTPNE